MLAGSLKLELAQYREVAAFGRCRGGVAVGQRIGVRVASLQPGTGIGVGGIACGHGEPGWLVGERMLSSGPSAGPVGGRPAPERSGAGVG